MMNDSDDNNDHHQMMNDSDDNNDHQMILKGLTNSHNSILKHCLQ